MRSPTPTQLLLTAMLGLLPVALLQASPLPLKLQLDWHWEGPAALFVYPQQLGYFQHKGLAVQIDAASGLNHRASAIQSVAAGSHDLGFTDLAALMEFHANNPQAPIKPVAVMVVYNTTPAAVIALKKSGIRLPADLNGKKLAAPALDTGRRSFPLFAQANQITGVRWTSVAARERERLLLRGEVDAITGFVFSSLLNLEASGVAAQDLQVLGYASHGVNLYGHVIIASPRLIAEHPQALRDFLQAFAKGAGQAMAAPEAAVAALKSQDAGLNAPLETRRLRLAIDTAINTSDGRAEGFGQLRAERLARMAQQVAKAYATRHPVPIDAVWDGRFLPSPAELDVLPPLASANLSLRRAQPLRPWQPSNWLLDSQSTLWTQPGLSSAPRAAYAPVSAAPRSARAAASRSLSTAPRVVANTGQLSWFSSR